MTASMSMIMLMTVEYDQAFDQAFHHDNYDDGCLYDILVLDKETDKLYAKRIKINNISKGRDNALIKSSKKMKVFYFSKVKLGPSKSVKIEVLDKLKLSSTLEVNFKNLQVEIYNVHSHCIFDACLDCKIIEDLNNDEK